MNKPVAWMTEEALKSLSIPFLSQVTLMTALKASQVDGFNIPLYTHPVKELTDEEIEECYWGDGYPDNPRHPKEFARAILRKAQDR